MATLLYCPLTDRVCLKSLVRFPAADSHFPGQSNLLLSGTWGAVRSMYKGCRYSAVLGELRSFAGTPGRC